MKIQDLLSEINNIVSEREKELKRLKEFQKRFNLISKPLESLISALNLEEISNTQSSVAKKDSVDLDDFSFIDIVEQTLDKINKESRAPKIYKELPENIRRKHKTVNVYNTMYNYAKRQNKFYKNGKKFGLIKWKSTKGLFDDT